ncbi:hypothetical protein [Nonomuraea longicatena]|uniref:DUF4190 domain-containing protein n=1 Tax=Nonomuraea longicatena TaxID=83682 RepID=A0ABN1PZJ5_9ACTN
MTTPDNPPPGDDQSPTPPPSYQAPPYQQPYGQPKPSSGTQLFSIFGFVCAGLALLILPIVFGPIGIVLGIVGHTRGEQLGKWAAVTAGVLMVVGMLLGYLVFAGLSR